MNDAQQPLFRPEVAEAKAHRLHGEVVLTQPVGTRALILLLVAIIGLVGAWIVLGEYTRTETARGILVTEAPSAKVMAIRPGIVTDLSVASGDLVAAGEQLAVVRVEQASGEGASAIGESLAAIQAQRGLAERQQALAGVRARSESARLSATLGGIAGQRADLAAQIALQEQVVASNEDILGRIATVAERGFVSKVEVEQRRQATIAERQELSRLKQQMTGLEAQASQARADLARVEADRGSAVANARMSIQSLAQQGAQLRGERAYALSAPISGRVTAVQTAVGRTVGDGVPLMVIVPEDSRLQATVYAPTRAIGFVEPGQEVRLLYDAFPYQRFGSFSGKVTRISRTVLDPRELDVPLKIDEAVYRIEVEPSKQSVAAYGEALPLQPGMTLTANLILDRRSFLDWLLQPLTAVLNRNQ